MAEKVTSDFRLQKHAKKGQLVVDQISQLPNDILANILSFLPIEEAAQTSILSKRWIDLWLYTATLNLYPKQMLQGIEEMDVDQIIRKSKRSKYVQWVNKVLQSHGAMVLDLFRIRFDLDDSSRHDIDKWLQYAFVRRVKRLDLNFSRHNRMLLRSGEVAYAFPYDLLGLNNANSTAVLNSEPFFGNDLTSGALFGFQSLRSLSFRNVNVSEEVVTFFLHNCPFLEYLVVDRSESLKQLKVCGPSLALKHLEIMMCFHLHSLIICNTNITSLKVSNIISIKHDYNLVLKNVPKLVDVSVLGSARHHLVGVPLSWISCCLSTLVVLSLQFIEYLGGPPEVKDSDVALPQLTKLKLFTLSVQASKDISLMEYTALIRASPNLEKFVLKLQWRPDIARIRAESNKVLASPVHHHLKEVELCGYYGRTTEVELVEYFVENALALRRITVDPREPLFVSHVDNPEAEEIARNLAKWQLPELVPSHVELVIL